MRFPGDFEFLDRMAKERDRKRKRERRRQEVPTAGEQKCRTATTTTDVIARERHGPRENAPGPPNNSPADDVRRVRVTASRRARPSRRCWNGKSLRAYISSLSF